MSVERRIAGKHIVVGDLENEEAWARTLGIPVAQLRTLVARVGNEVDNVRASLNWSTQPIRSARRAVG
jgi:hypothetical protein